MNKIHKRRIYIIVFFAAGVGIASAFILLALQQNINFFVTPTELQTKAIAEHARLRLGGLVKKASIKRREDLNVDFVVTDLAADILVQFRGVLPDLFREEKGVIVEGFLQKNGVFLASTVLAKHDENYMPKKVYQQLRNNQHRPSTP